MKKIISSLSIFILLFSNILFAQEKNLKADTPRDGVFIHITASYDNPHRLLMPLKMATMMAKDKDVLIYMDIEAVKVLVKGAIDITHPEFESAHTYIKPRFVIRDFLLIQQKA